MPGERIILKTREKIRGLEEGNWVKEEEKGEETEGATSRLLGRFAPPREKYQGKITLSFSSSSSFFSSSPLSLPLSVLRGVRGTEGAPPAGRFGRGKVNAPRRTVSRCEAEQCRRRRRRYHRRRHLEQIMARIRRGGERTAGRTGFSWVGLGWVGITSAIDLITPCGPRCLLVSVPLSLSISLLVLTLPLSLTLCQPSCPSRVRRHPRILSLSLSHCPLFHACPLRVSPLASSPAASSTCVSTLPPLRALPVSISLLLSRPRVFFSRGVPRCLPFPPPSLHRHAALHPGTFPFSLLAAARRSTARPSYLSSATHTRCVTAACSWMLIFRRIISPGEENLKHRGSYDAPS